MNHSLTTLQPPQHPNLLASISTPDNSSEEQPNKLTSTKITSRERYEYYISNAQFYVKKLAHKGHLLTLTQVNSGRYYL